MTDLQFAGAKGFRLDPLLGEGNHIRQIKNALTRLGYYRPDRKTGVTDERDPQFKDALYAFQRSAAIFFDDTDIGPGSTTERILNRELVTLNDDVRYVWRTVGDGKVREGHASKEGHVFRWSDLEDGAHPGEDYNCRCWAEPVNPPWNPWIDWVRNIHDPQNPYADAINPTWSPLDFVSLGAVAVGVKATKNFIDTRPILKRPDGVPKEWGEELVQNGVGKIYKDPKDRSGGTYVKVQKGRPENSMAGQRYDNVRWQKDGKSFDVNGNIVDRRSKESHIPIKDFKFNPEKFK